MVAGAASLYDKVLLPQPPMAYEWLIKNRKEQKRTEKRKHV